MRQRSWFGLLSYCLVAVVGVSMTLATLMAGATFALGFAQDSPSRSEESSAASTFSGIITDSRCKAKHLSSSGKTSAECTRFCVRHGAKYLLLNGDDAYVLQGDRTKLDALAGRRVQVEGVLHGSMLKIHSIKPEQLSAE